MTLLEVLQAYVANNGYEVAGEYIVPMRNKDAEAALVAVLNLIEAAKYAREQSQQLIGMDDPFGSQGPPILIGANAWFELADAVAVLVSGQEEPK